MSQATSAQDVQTPASSAVSNRGPIEDRLPEFMQPLHIGTASAVEIREMLLEFEAYLPGGPIRELSWAVLDVVVASECHS